MFFIECPYCHESRSEKEFSRADEAFIERPAIPESLDDYAWADYLFHRANTKGVFWEQWSHAHGCRKYFVIERNTASHEIIASHTLDDAQKKNAKRKAAELPAVKIKKPAKNSSAKSSPAKSSPTKNSLAKKTAVRKKATSKR